MNDRLAQPGPQRLRVRQKSIEALFRLGLDVFVGHVAQGEDEPGAQQCAVVTVRTLPGEPVEHAPQPGARIGLEGGAFGPAALELIDPAEDADDLLPNGTAVVRADLVHQLEIGCRPRPAGLDQCPGVGQQIEPVDGRHQRHRSGQRQARRVVVVHAEIADIAEIELDRLAASAGGDLLRPVLQQHGFEPAASARNGPIVTGMSQRGAAAPGSWTVNGSCRNVSRCSSPMQAVSLRTSGTPAWLVKLATIPATGLPDADFQCAREIGAGRAAVRVILHVFADACAERLLADMVFEHADQRLTLGVGRGIEYPHVLIGDRLLKGARGAARIARHRALLARVAVKPDLPLRIEVIGRFQFHPGREAFVEPEVVPPAHGDEVAEPLMGDLMSYQLEDFTARAVRVRGRIEQDAVLREHDRAPVLHAGDAAAAGIAIRSSFGSGYLKSK